MKQFNGLKKCSENTKKTITRLARNCKWSVLLPPGDQFLSAKLFTGVHPTNVTIALLGQIQQKGQILLFSLFVKRNHHLFFLPNFNDLNFSNSIRTDSSRFSQKIKPAFCKIYLFIPLFLGRQIVTKPRRPSKSKS